MDILDVIDEEIERGKKYELLREIVQGVLYSQSFLFISNGRMVPYHTEKSPLIDKTREYYDCEREKEWLKLHPEDGYKQQ